MHHVPFGPIPSHRAPLPRLGAPRARRQLVRRPTGTATSAARQLGQSRSAGTDDPERRPSTSSPLGKGCRHAKRAPETLPVGETGVARARADPPEGDHPACTRLDAPWPCEIPRRRGRSGRPAGPAAQPLHPGLREGGALSSLPAMARGRASATQAMDRLSSPPPGLYRKPYKY